MIRASLALLVVFACATSCVTAPKYHSFKKSWKMSSGFDQVWGAAIELFAEKGWEISTLEKDSGIISSEWIGVATGSDVCDCGGSGIASARNRQGKLNIYIKRGIDGATVIVNTSFREYRSFDNNAWWQECTSTGNLEARVHEEILNRAR